MNGRLYPNVKYFNSHKEAKRKIKYDKLEYNEESDNWLYFWDGLLVAATGGPIIIVDLT